MADVRSAHALVARVLDENLAKNGAQADRDDFQALLLMELWDLWLAWQPERGVPFAAYATGLLRLRAANYYRQLLGRHVRKAHNDAVSFESICDETGELAGSYAAGAGDPATDRSQDIGWVLAR
jgi:hypothetical protein